MNRDEQHVRWFGEPWPSADFRAGVCEDDAHLVTPPPGTRCAMCDQELDAADRGVSYPELHVDAPPAWVFTHLACFLADILGLPAR